MYKEQKDKNRPVRVVLLIVADLCTEWSFTESEQSE